LTALTVRQITEPGLHPDGGGLHLQVSPTGTKSWILKFQLNGRARAMGLGSLHIVGLADARAARDAAHLLLREGVDPIEVRKAELQRKRAEPAKAVSFREAAIACIKDREAEWHNQTHARQWSTTLADYAYPIIGDLPVQAVDTTHVMKVLQQDIPDEGNSALPFWRAHPETASRLRGRIETILDWAKVRGYRDGENPARWRGHLDSLLPKKSKIAKVVHHAAMDYREIGTFMVALRERETVSAMALEFLNLTATRTSETLNADWNEINLAERLWTIPGRRTKTGREHRVPLSDAAMTLLERLQMVRQGNVVFPGRRSGCSFSKMALLEQLDRMGRDDLTVHGFRSTFRDWAAERTNFPSEVAEMALAHAVGSKVESAYRRTDLFERRRRLMADWSDYCGTPPATEENGNIVPIRA
jgi:integrase